MKELKTILPSVLSSLQNPEKKARTKLLNEWNKIAGEKIAPRSKPSLAKDGKLYVWVEQSTLAFEINQRFKPTLLKRAQAAIGEDEVKEIYVRVGQLRPY